MLSVFFCEKLKKFKTNIDKCVYMVYNISTIKKTRKQINCWRKNNEGKSI